MGIALETKSYFDLGGGVDLKTSATKAAEDASTSSLNVDYSVDGAVSTRNGSSIQNKTLNIPNQMSGAPKTLALYDYHKSDGTEVTLIVTDDGYIKTDITAPSNVVTLTSAGNIPDFEFVVTGDDEYLIYCDGVNTNLKFDGTTWTNLSLPRPVAPTIVDSAAGTLSAGTYYYYVSYARTVGGIIVQEGELSPLGSITLGASRQTTVTFTACSETLQTGVTAQCNARVLYRSNQTDGVVYRLTTIADNTTLTYADNTSDAELIDGGIEADFDLQATPLTAVIELDDYGCLWSRDESKKTDGYISKPYKPWASPATNFQIFDGKINCYRRCFGTLIIGTDKSLWVQNGNFADVEPRKFSSKIGILNNRCAAGESILYIVATNRKVYSITPTDFSQNEMRLSDDLSFIVGPLFDQIGSSASDDVCIEYYNKSNVGKLAICAPIGSLENNKVIVYNETQSLLKQKAVWQPWDNINAAAIKQMSIDGEIGIYSGDYNGFIWKLDDPTLNGDGTEQNGTCTSSTATTITDSSQTWDVNELVGCSVRIIEGYGSDQVRTVVSNTADTITVDSAWGNNPNTTSIFTVGGYDSYHYTNWKVVTGTYEVLKRLWFIWVNANASGNYTVKLITQFDFNTTTTDQIELNISLQSDNAIWGSFDWGAGIWGARAVFEDRFRQLELFRAVRFGFSNRYAGQPFQINGFSISAQNKGLLFRST